MITEDYEALVRNNDRGTYLGSNKQKVNGNNITKKQRNELGRDAKTEPGDTEL